MQLPSSVKRVSIIMLTLQFVIHADAFHDRRDKDEGFNVAYFIEENQEVGDTVCRGEVREYRVIAEGSSIFLWWVDGVLQHENDAMITVEWNVSGFHKVEVQEMASSGCYGEIAACEVQVVDCSPSSMQPTAFTPDGDGLNDQFRPMLMLDKGVPVTYEFKVFNKRGLILFESVTPGAAWDGYYKGVLLPTDNYYYELKIKYTGSKKSERLIGTILLINRT